MVVLKTLSASGSTSTLASRVMIGLLVVQDLAVIPMLIVLPQLADFSGALPRLARAAGIAAVVLAAMVVLGRWLLPILLQACAGARARASCSWWRWWRPEWESDTRRMRLDSRLPWARLSPEWC